MENNNIQNDINDINIGNNKDSNIIESNKKNESNDNENNINNKEETNNNSDISDIKSELNTPNNNISEGKLEENEKNIEKNKKIKYRINFSVIIANLRKISDKEEKMNEIEFVSNILLMSSEVNQSNKMSFLTLISFTNFKKNNSLYIYYLNKKILKYLQIQKGIESFIYIRTLFRAATFLQKDGNYFYAYKYVKEAELLSKNSKINDKSLNMLNDLKREIINKINDYKDTYIKKFRDVETPQNLCDEKYQKLKTLIKDLIENKYQIKNEENNETNKNNDEYLYLINAKWVDRANNFLKDYINVRENCIKSNYFGVAFDPDLFYHNYFELEEKKTPQFYPFPGIIDNFSISDWTDNWYDPLNEDENNYIKSNLVYNKDYYLLEKSDFDFLNDFFGVTNVIKRKKDYLEFVVFKAIIFDKRISKQENYFLLRKRNIQIRKNSTILNLKEKILRCVEESLKQIEQKEKPKINTNDLEKDIINSNINKNENNIEDIKTNESNENNIEDNKREEINEKIIKDNNDKILNEKNNIYNIYFYLLEKDNKDILIEMCISFVNGITQYDSLFLKSIKISDNDNISDLLSFLDKKKHILIIEIQHNDDPLFLKEIQNGKLFCAECLKEIYPLSNKYECNICHLSLFCSEECANKNENHKKLDDIFCNEYLVEEFNLKKFLKKDLNNFFEPEQLKGMVGLENLGNTCYMNSALQCLSNTFDLTKYFLLKYYMNDINRGNKLGSNGKIVNEYYNLIKSMWCGKEPKIAPKEFISKFQNEKKQLAGYRQQDSQEFLSLLLDQLHEDLNRISNKPYIELLEKQPNEDDITASKRWWDLHKKREDSIIIDLFNGQLKSVTTCQVCGKSSITYDPFMFLCLPLPKAKMHLLLKIICGIECKLFNFDYSENSTLSDLKNKAMDFIKMIKQSNTAYFDLEIVLLDKNKKIIEIIQINEKSKNNKGKMQLCNFLVNKNEIIFYEKNIYSNEKDYIDIFVYPIEKQTPVMEGYIQLTSLYFFAYPLYFQVKKSIKIKEFSDKVYERLEALNFYSEKISNYKKDFSKILDLNIIHGKETKKEGFTTWFSIEDKCKYCRKSNEKLFYCSISNFTSDEQILENSFHKFKKPLILLATSECYNKSGDSFIYLEANTFINNSDSMGGMYGDNINLKDCLDLYGEDINLTDEDMWYCSQCQKHQISKQKLQIYKSPIYLIVQIKRFNINKKYGCETIFNGEKNNTFVSYPIKDFNLSEYIVGPEKNNIKYDLYGVIQHFGSLNGGHYTAICKNDNNWVIYNDSKLDFIDNPVTNNAYILFYKRKDLEENISKINNEEKNEKKLEKNNNINDNDEQ